MSIWWVRKSNFKISSFFPLTHFHSRCFISLGKKTCPWKHVRLASWYQVSNFCRSNFTINRNYRIMFNAILKTFQPASSALSYRNGYFTWKISPKCTVSEFPLFLKSSYHSTRMLLYQKLKIKSNSYILFSPHAFSFISFFAQICVLGIPVEIF